MRCRTLALSIAAALPLASLAQSSDSYECALNGLTRRIEVVRETSAPVPCEVRYHKDDEAPGAPQVLWSASNEAGYCETQAQGLVERLEGFGWQCSDGAGDKAPAATAQAESGAAAKPVRDDTDVLLAPE